MDSNTIFVTSSDGRFMSEKTKRIYLIDAFQQMMYVSGETAEPSVETTGIIEDIVRQQVIELVCQLTILYNLV